MHNLYTHSLEQALVKGPPIIPNTKKSCGWWDGQYVKSLQNQLSLYLQGKGRLQVK